MKLTYDNSTVSDRDLIKYKKKVLDAHKKLCEKNGLGNYFLGWLDVRVDKEEISE